MLKREFWQYFDYVLFGSVVILCIFGIVMIRSAVAGNVELEGAASSQVIFVVTGLIITLVVAAIDYHYWFSLWRWMYIFVILLLIFIYLVGDVAFGSRRWINVGPVNIQPSELAKIVMVIVLARYYANAADKPKDLRWLAKGLALTVVMVIPIVMQPNLSMTIVMFVLWLSMTWISGVPPKYLALMAGIGVAGIVLFLLLISLGVEIPFIEEYQIRRVVNFLFPDPNARHGDTYNVEQALITIGSGGLFGQGYGHSSQVQLRYLKVRHTDFIFSAMASEFGFVGTALVMLLLLFVVLRCIRVARRASDMFGALIAYGFATLLFFQTAVNIGVNLKVIPVTGLTLPFISYGGSSLLSLVLGLGLVESVAARHKSLNF